MYAKTQIAFYDELEKIAIQWRFTAEQADQIRNEMKDPRMPAYIRTLGKVGLIVPLALAEKHKKKEAGIGSFLAGGARGIGKVLSGKGVAGAAKAGGIMPHMKQIWSAGADKAAKGGSNRILGGLGALGRSNYGQMAGAVAAPLAVGYGAHKVLSD